MQAKDKSQLRTGLVLLAIIWAFLYGLFRAMETPSTSEVLEDLHEQLQNDE